jgi:2-polyprenyl-6-hydroxyphenyl methylase/3-demethylubiquinone-9 3-methyltransferase
VLEVGYGSGITFLNLTKLYNEIHGIDLHRHAGIVRGVFEVKGICPRLCTGNILQLPYDDGVFDAVLCVSILEHLQPNDLLRAVVEVSRVLRPAGRFVYGVPCERPLMRAAFRTLGYDIRQHHFSTERHVSEAADAQLQCIALHSYRPFRGIFGTLYQVGVYERR